MRDVGSLRLREIRGSGVDRVCDFQADGRGQAFLTGVMTEELPEAVFKSNGDVERVQCSAAEPRRMGSGERGTSVPRPVPVGFERIEDACGDIVSDAVHGGSALREGAFPPELFQAQSAEAFRSVQRGEPKWLTPRLHPRLHNDRLFFRSVEFEEEAGVVVCLHRSPRVVSNASSEEVPDHVSPQISRFRFAKSGKLTGVSSSTGRIRATSLLRRVIPASLPCSTSRSTLERLCWVSMIENVFITHKINA